MSTTVTADRPTLADQAGTLMGQVAGYVGHRTIEMGLRLGLVEALARHPEGVTAETLAAETSLDRFYVEVWLRAAGAAAVVDPDGAAHRLAPHVATLLLDTDSPAYVGGVFTVLSQPEVFDTSA